MANVKTAKPKGNKQWHITKTIKKEELVLAETFFAEKGLLENSDQNKFFSEIITQYMKGEINVKSKEVEEAEENKLTEDELKAYADEDNKTQMQELVVLFNAQENSYSENRRFTNKFFADLHTNNLELKSEIKTLNEKLDRLLGLLGSNGGQK